MLPAQTQVPSAVSPPGKVDFLFQPVEIGLEVKFLDQNDNQALDGGETDFMSITVSCDGPGKAYDLRLQGATNGEHQRCDRQPGQDAWNPATGAGSHRDLHPGSD